MLSKQRACPWTTERIREQILRFGHTSYSSLFPRGIIKYHSRAALPWQPWELTFLLSQARWNTDSSTREPAAEPGRIPHRLLNWQGYTLGKTVISMKGDLYDSLLLYNYKSQMKLSISACNRNVNSLSLLNDRSEGSPSPLLLQCSRCNWRFLEKPNKWEN